MAMPFSLAYFCTGTSCPKSSSALSEGKCCDNSDVQMRRVGQQAISKSSSRFHRLTLLRVYASSRSWVIFSLSRCAGYYLPITKMRPYRPFIEFVSVISMWHYNKIKWSRAQAQSQKAYSVTRFNREFWENECAQTDIDNTTQTLKSHNLKPACLQGLHWLVGLTKSSPIQSRMKSRLWKELDGLKEKTDIALH